MQSIGEAYDENDAQIKELMDFQELDPVEGDHVIFYQAEKVKVSEKLEVSNKNITDDTNKIKDMELANLEKYEKTQQLNLNIVKYLETLANKEGKLLDMKVLFSKSRTLQEDIEREERLNSSRDTENEYMRKEIEKVSVSLKETAQEIEKVQEGSAEVETSLQALLEATGTQKVDVLSNITAFEENIEIQKIEYQNLKSELSELLTRLGKLPTHRVRTGNNNQGLSRRHNK